MQKPAPIDEAYLFDNGIIISTTDKEGVITYINRKFCEVSGYNRDELKDQNHHIVRHPDMPKAVFKELWEIIQSGKEWTGVVKNLRKDGKFYWAYIHIAPLFTDGTIYGYTAATRPALANEIDEITPIYTEMLKKENN
jgi:aerotaxis receptor